jgi:hypothetical protein
MEQTLFEYFWYMRVEMFSRSLQLVSCYAAQHHVRLIIVKRQSYVVSCVRRTPFQVGVGV